MSNGEVKDQVKNKVDSQIGQYQQLEETQNKGQKIYQNSGIKQMKRKI